MGRLDRHMGGHTTIVPLLIDLFHSLFYCLRLHSHFTIFMRHMWCLFFEAFSLLSFIEWGSLLARLYMLGSWYHCWCLLSLFDFSLFGTCIYALKWHSCHNWNLLIYIYIWKLGLVLWCNCFSLGVSLISMMLPGLIIWFLEFHAPYVLSLTILLWVCPGQCVCLILLIFCCTGIFVHAPCELGFICGYLCFPSLLSWEDTWPVLVLFQRLP